MLKTRYIYNVSKMKTLSFTVFNDEAYYIKPDEKVKQLKLFFNNIRVFLLNDCNETGNNSFDLKNIDDDWLYFLCN